MSATLRRFTLEMVGGNRPLLEALSALYDVAVQGQRAASAATYGTWVVNGGATGGLVELPPQMAPDGTIYQRATAGSNVIGVVELSPAVVDVKSAFEPVISQTDNIKQLAFGSLAAATLLVLVAN